MHTGPSRTGFRRTLAVVLATVVSVPLVAVVGTSAASASASQRLRPQQDRSVPGRDAPPAPVPAAPFTRLQSEPAPVWPVPGAAEVTVGAGTQRIGGLGIRLSGSGAPATVRVAVLDRAAASESAVDGLLLSLRRTDGADTPATARLTVNYAAFRTAYGGDWASRLRLTARTGGAPGAVRNDLAAGVLSADVIVSGRDSIVALEAVESGPVGDYAATALQPSSVWSAGGNSGNFTWSYDMRVPPVAGDLTPPLDLRYSSATVDGRMSLSNNQPSWVGEGFEWNPGFIERRYLPCEEDGGGSSVPKDGDLCWARDNAVLSFGERSGELLRGGNGLWHLRGDDGTRIERRTGASNGDNDGEHWVITTPDGTQYWFGRNRLPGWTSGKAGSNAVWTVPVFGNHAGEPCHSGNVCTQAWRWNLDYVVDPHGNTMSYWYVKETNVYLQAQATRTTYVRAGHLDRIDYGTRSDTSYGTVPARVEIDVADRCLTTTCGTHNATNWPDTPFDLECTTSTSDACLIGAPTFWTTKRLAKIRTQVWSGTTHQAVETWSFQHSFADPGDGTNKRLWLGRIGHAGHVGGDVTLPDVTFTGVQLANRVDATDLAPAMNWWRLANIRSEAGGSIDVTYANPECVAGSRIPDVDQLHANSLRCYPVKWKPEGTTSYITDFFHKHVVTTVTETDLALPSDARSPRTVTRYEYLGSPAWRYTDDDGLIEDKVKTWSVWRGYERVRTITGDPGEQASTETSYFRGMHGDRLPSGTRSVSLPAAGGAPAVTDHDAFAGTAREALTHNGPGGSVVEATVSEPWQSEPTATRTIAGSTVEARLTGIAAQWRRVALDGGRGWRRSTNRTTFDAYGMPVREEETGDEASLGDERCTVTAYARNTGAWLMSYPSRVERFAVDCATVAAGGLTVDDLISDERTSYDQTAHGVAPTRGLVSRVEELGTWPAGYVTTSRATHDAHGRVRESWDARGARTETRYTPAVGGPTTTVTTLNPLGWESVETLEPAFGRPTAIEDANDKVTRLAYDGLGRLTKVWLPGRATTATPDRAFSYQVRADAATVVTTSRLTPSGTTTTYTLFDGHLRARQTQAPAAGTGGRIITDTLYDTVGRVVKRNGPYVADGAPSANLFLPLPDAQIPAQTVTEYDGAGREKTSVFLVNGDVRWRTRTDYGGDRTDVTPPAGATPTSTVVDVRGRTVQLRQYHAATPTGIADTTGYTYDRQGRLVAVTDVAGNRWAYEYDLRGRRIVADDPDKGRTTMTHNAAGDMLTSTDARGGTLAYTYDELGRRTSVRVGSVTGTKRAEWVYDAISGSSTVRGQLAYSTRWEGGSAYVNRVLGYDDGYRPTGLSITIPPAEQGLSGTYTYAYSYHPDGSPATTRLPAVGGLPTETLATGYNTLGRPDTLRTTLSGTGEDTFYVNGTGYTRYGEVSVLGRRYEDGAWLDSKREYEHGTRRLAQILATRQTEPALVADLRHDHDEAGNILSIADVPTTGTADTQCFAYDRLQRLTEAWTPASGSCAAIRSVAALGGPAPYWQSFTYDAVGNRTAMVDHGDSETRRSYTYPAAGTSQPHTMRSVQTTGPGAGTASYGYDAAGNTVTRPGALGVQTLTWDAEGRLATSTTGAEQTSYVYDADGNRLVAREPGGRTLHLPSQELHSTDSGARTASRYYAHAGQTVAVRTNAGLAWLVEDHQGTAFVAVRASDQETTRRRQKPFGAPRGVAPATWPGDRGYVGGTLDGTGTVHLGAREYDPAAGRFLSVDPIVDFNDPQQMHGYAYASSSPVTQMDPDGLLEWPGEGWTGPQNPCTGSCATYSEYETEKAKKKGNGSGASGGGSSGRGCTGKCAAESRCDGHTGCRAKLVGSPNRPKPPGKPTIWDPVCRGWIKIMCGPATWVPVRMVGVCVGADVGVLVTGNASVCAVADSTGPGMTVTGGYGVSAADTTDPFLGFGLVGSTGDIRDQNEWFEYESLEATVPVRGKPINGQVTHSHGRGQQQQRVDTVQLLIAPEKKGFGGFGVSHGRSYTWTARWDIFD
jgi:RHS repeat-associated protein